MADPAIQSHHWLAEQVEALTRLSDGGGSRPEFLRAVEEVVDRVAARPDITACFAAYEGLLVATAGQTANFDALAAAAQQAMEATQTDLLGPLDQMALVGARDKLAILRVGPILLGILSPRGSSIARSTS